MTLVEEQPKGYILVGTADTFDQALTIVRKRREENGYKNPVIITPPDNEGKIKVVEEVIE